MKKILKKLGVLGLIIAILAPFTKLPVVNAETTNCSKHLQNYMFLDVNWFGEINDGTFLNLYDSKNSFRGYKTYTKFPYAFTETQNSKIKVNWVETNNFNTNTTIDELDDYWKLASKKDNATNITASLKTDWYNRYTGTETLGAVFIKENTVGNYADKTVIFHGVWSSVEMDGRPTHEEDENINFGDLTELESVSIQNVLKSEDLQYINANVSTVGFKDGGFEVSHENFGTEYFQKIVDGTLKPTDDENLIIPLSINRSMNFTELNLDKYKFGFVNTNGITIFTENTSATSKSEINDSYTAYKKYLNSNLTESEKGTKFTKHFETLSENDLDFNTQKKYYWPVVLTLEYEVCPLADTTEEWTLTYHDNVNDAEITVPAQQKEKVGTNLKTSTTKPERSGYVFQKWCESANGSGQCYTPGQEVASPKEGKDVPLYAIWGATNTVDNPKQGVISYIIGFAAVGVVAGGIYLISKKKNLFKQI